MSRKRNSLVSCSKIGDCGDLLGDGGDLLGDGGDLLCDGGDLLSPKGTVFSSSPSFNVCRLTHPKILEVEEELYRHLTKLPSSMGVSLVICLFCINKNRHLTKRLLDLVNRPLVECP